MDRYDDDRDDLTARTNPNESLTGQAGSADILGAAVGIALIIVAFVMLLGWGIGFLERPYNAHSIMSELRIAPFPVPPSQIEPPKT
jgi:hypothetical protein